MSQTIHRNTIEFEVCGDYALFSDVLTRPSGEKCTYDIPTYEAIKGIVHSIYFKPTILWKVDAVRIMNPIRTERKGMRPLKMNGENDLAYYCLLYTSCRAVLTSLHVSAGVTGISATIFLQPMSSDTTNLPLHVPRY